MNSPINIVSFNPKKLFTSFKYCKTIKYEIIFIMKKIEACSKDNLNVSIKWWENIGKKNVVEIMSITNAMNVGIIF